MNSVLIFKFILVQAAAYVATALLVPLNIKLAWKTGLVSIPNERSIHSVPTPTAGGLSFGLVIVLMQLYIGIVRYSAGYGNALIRLALISIPLLAFGVFDDKGHSRVRYKLAGQIIITLLMFFAGYRVTYLTNPLGDHFLLGWLSLPVTLIWFLLVMNAVNLIDGLDGLASGLACIVSLVLAVIGLISGNALVLALTAILFGSNLAFLRYNFYPAKIFMGDTGSLLIGLNIAAISTAGTSTFKGITTMTMMVPVIVLAVPLIDTCLAVFRRIGKGSIFRPDKAHLHHYLLKLGLSQSTIALIVYFLTFLFGLAAIGFSFTSHKVLFSLVVMLMAVLIVISYYLMHRGHK